MLSEYRGEDGRSMTTIDTIDLLGILAVFLGAAIATTGLATLFGVTFAEYTFSYAGTSIGVGIVMIAGGLASIIITNGISRQEFLNANSLEGVLFLVSLGVTLALFFEPQIVTELVINNNWGQLTLTGLYVTLAGLLGTQ